MNIYKTARLVGFLSVFVAIPLCALAPAAWSHGSDLQSAVKDKFDKSRALEFSQAAVGQRVGDYRFVNRNGREVKLSSYLGRPVIVSFVYTSCFHTCPLVTRRLDAVVRAARGVFGMNGFNVLTVGFDAEVDSPERMRAFAAQQRVGDPGWSFLSADQKTIAAFSAELGFIYFPSLKGFDHLSQTSIIDAEGRVYRQVYGERLDPPDIIEPLKELAFGRKTGESLVSNWVDGIRLFCTVYDPASQKYRFDYSVLVTVITGIASLGAIALFLVHGWRQHRASRRPGT